MRKQCYDKAEKGRGISSGNKRTFYECLSGVYIMEKTMAEMNNKELFSVLTGSRGIVPQMLLQNIIRTYRKGRMNANADLRTMVQAYLGGEC